MRQDEDNDPVIQTEEEMMLMQVDRGLLTEHMGYGLGGSGLIPLRDFLIGHLPPTLTAVVGRIMTPDDRRSSELAVLIVDRRYPILEEDLDGFVTVMLHSVLAAIVVRSLATADTAESMRACAKELSMLVARIDWDRDGKGKTALVRGFAYRSALSRKALEEEYLRVSGADPSPFELTVLRLSEEAQATDTCRGIELRGGPGVRHDDGGAAADPGMSFAGRCTNLSAFWHRLIVDVNGIFFARNLTDDDMESHFAEYPSWSSLLDEVIRARREMSQGEGAEGEGEG